MYLRIYLEYILHLFQRYLHIYLQFVLHVLGTYFQVFPQCIPTYMSHIFLIHIPNICEIYFCNILRHLSHEYITEYIDAIYLAIYLQNIFNLYI